MADEKPKALPLSGEEIKKAILYKVEESLEKTCHLKDDTAYTSFKGSISIKLVLSDFGREVMDNHEVHAEHLDNVSLQKFAETSHAEEHTLKIEPAPPNQVRIETEQGVPVQSVEGGKTVTRNLKYARRKANV